MYNCQEKWIYFYFYDETALENKNDPVTKALKDSLNIFYENNNFNTDNPLNNYDIQGIIIDDEGMEKSFRPKVINLYQYLKKKLNIKIGWSQGLASTNKICPKNSNPCVQWDYFLAQVYTTDYDYNYYYTTKKNNKGDNCTIFKKNNNGTYDFDDNSHSLTKSNSIYGNLYYSYIHQIKNPNYPVTMLCGSGNCQENNGCIDERKSTKDIFDLICNRPKNFPFKNFAIWYGTGRDSSCSTCDNPCNKNKTEEDCNDCSDCEWDDNNGYCYNNDSPWGCEKDWYK